MGTSQTNEAKASTQSLILRLAEKFGVDSAKLLRCLTTQVFRQSDGGAPSNEELMVLLLVCENYGLNPFNREIYAFRARKGGPIVPIVSYDGWCKIVRSQKDFNGVTFSFSQTSVRLQGSSIDLPEFVECSIRLKGIDEPITIQEFMVECFNETSPVWRKWPRRMLRTRAFIQCARLAFSLTGIYDEGDDFFEASSSSPAVPTLRQADSAPKLMLERKKLDAMIDRLVTHAQQRDNGWERALQWIDLNLAGDDRIYAANALKAKRQGCTPLSATLEPIAAINNIPELGDKP